MMNDDQPIIVPATSLPVRRRIMPTTVVTPSVSKSCTHNGCGNECEIEKKLEAARMQLEKKDIETKLKHDKAVLAAAASDQDNKNRDIEIQTLLATCCSHNNNGACGKYPRSLLQADAEVDKTLRSLTTAQFKESSIALIRQYATDIQISCVILRHPLLKLLRSRKNTKLVCYTDPIDCPTRNDCLTQILTNPELTRDVLELVYMFPKDFGNKTSVLRWDNYLAHADTTTIGYVHTQLFKHCVVFTDDMDDADFKSLESAVGKIKSKGSGVPLNQAIMELEARFNPGGDPNFDPLYDPKDKSKNEELFTVHALSSYETHTKFLKLLKRNDEEPKIDSTPIEDVDDGDDDGDDDYNPNSPSGSDSDSDEEGKLKISEAVDADGTVLRFTIVGDESDEDDSKSVNVDSLAFRVAQIRKIMDVAKRVRAAEHKAQLVLNAIANRRKRKAEAAKIGGTTVSVSVDVNEKARERRKKRQESKRAMRDEKQKSKRHELDEILTTRAIMYEDKQLKRLELEKKRKERLELVLARLSTPKPAASAAATDDDRTDTDPDLKSDGSETESDVDTNVRVSVKVNISPNDGDATMTPAVVVSSSSSAEASASSSESPTKRRRVEVIDLVSD